MEFAALVAKWSPIDGAERASGEPPPFTPTTRRMAITNIALRGIAADLGVEQADSLRNDLRGAA